MNDTRVLPQGMHPRIIYTNAYKLKNCLFHKITVPLHNIYQVTCNTNNKNNFITL